jgi:hypothetical protein
VRFVAKDAIEEFMEEFAKLMEEHQFEPMFIWNFDETMLRLADGKLKVFTPREQPRPVNVQSDKPQEHITLGITISADGNHIDPLVILSLAEAPDLPKELDKFFAIGGQSSGWMNSNIFVTFIETMFASLMDSYRERVGKPNAPVLLIVDGHISRYALDVKSLVEKFNIYVLVIPSHSSHLIQPLDLLFFFYFKTQLRRLWHADDTETRPQARIRLLEAAKAALEFAFNKGTIKESFKRSGLCPFDRHKHSSSPFVNPAPVTPPSPTSDEAPAGKRRRISLKGGKILFDGELFGAPENAYDSKIRIVRRADPWTDEPVLSVVPPLSRTIVSDP